MVETTETKSLISKVLQQGLRNFIAFSKSIGGFLFWAVLLWIFLFEAEQASKNEMKPTLLQNETVLISKWQFGARSPQRFWLPFVEFSLPALQLQFPGLRNPEKEEVIAFYYQNQGKADIAFGRIVALPTEKISEAQLRAFVAPKTWQSWQLARSSPQIILPKSRIKALDIDFLQQNTQFIRVNGVDSVVQRLAALPYLGDKVALQKMQFPFFAKNNVFQVPQNHYLVLPDNRTGQHAAQLVSAKNLIGKAWRVLWAADENGLPKLDKLFRRIR
jgi:signal peptidase I